MLIYLIVWFVDDLGIIEIGIYMSFIVDEESVKCVIDVCCVLWVIGVEVGYGREVDVVVYIL